MKRGLASRPPIVRMARIHAMLRQGGRVNCSRVAAELEMSKRTILRDIEFMRYQLDLPIEYDHAGRTFAYSGPVTGALFGALLGRETA